MRHTLFLLGGSLLAACAPPTTSPPAAVSPDAVGDIALDVAVLDFGAVLPATTAARAFHASNPGEAPLTITDVILPAGYFPDGFATPVTIPPGTSAEFSVRYGFTGSYSALAGTIEVRSDDPDEPVVTLVIDGYEEGDVDGDGALRPDAGGADCDDADPSVYPGAPDAWYDGIDSDCDGADDYDQDRDGFTASAYNADPEAGGGDCQDNNPDIWPDSSAGINPNEVWYDGVDHNCDRANDYDQDGDGYAAAAVGRGGDCDDLDPERSPGADEYANGIDDDCDDTIDLEVDAWRAEWTYTGTATGDRAGAAILLADLDGDGHSDVLAGAPGYDGGAGAVAVFDGAALPATGATIADGHNLLTGGTGAAGISLAWLEGASRDAVLIGSGDGTLVAIEASEVFYGSLSDAFLTIEGAGLGAGLAGDLDLNGDGQDDLAGWEDTTDGNAAWLLYGGVQGTMDRSEVDVRLSTGGISSATRATPLHSGDLDADGYDDLIVCDGQAGGGGVVWAVWGSGSRMAVDADIDTHGTALLRGSEHAQLGQACGVTGDTLWVAVTDTGGDLGGVYAFDGADVDSLQSLSDASRRYTTRSGDGGAWGMASLGDWDGDGHDDILVGMGPAGADTGFVRAYPGSAAANSSYNARTDALISLSGESVVTQFSMGRSLSLSPGDTDGDSHSDLLIADRDATTTTAGQAGAIYLTTSAR